MIKCNNYLNYLSIITRLLLMVMLFANCSKDEYKGNYVYSLSGTYYNTVESNSYRYCIIDVDTKYTKYAFILNVKYYNEKHANNRNQVDTCYYSNSSYKYRYLPHLVLEDDHSVSFKSNVFGWQIFIKQ